MYETPELEKYICAIQELLNGDIVPDFLRITGDLIRIQDFETLEEFREWMEIYAASCSEISVILDESPKMLENYLSLKRQKVRKTLEAAVEKYSSPPPAA